MTEWVVILKVDINAWAINKKEFKYYSQFVGRAFPIIKIKKINGKVGMLLPVSSYNEPLHMTWWHKNEIRPATEKERRLGELEIGAEKI